MNIDHLRSLVGPVVTSLGCELVDVRCLTERGRSVLRLKIDREGGVTVEDCSRISREVGTLLDVEESIRSRYDLEVSSPGLDRPLTGEADFVRYAGKVAAIRTGEPIDGRRNFKGVLKGVEEDRVIVVIDGQEHRVPIALIERGHLVF